MSVHEVKMVLFPLPAIFIVHLGGRKLDGFLERCLQRSHYGSQHGHELCVYFDLHAYPLSQWRLLIQSFFFAITMYTGVITCYNCACNDFKLKNKTKHKFSLYSFKDIIIFALCTWSAAFIICVRKISIRII